MMPDNKDLQFELERLRNENLELKAAEEKWNITHKSLQLANRFLEIANRHTERQALFEEIIAQVKSITSCSAIGLRLMDEVGNIPYDAYIGFKREFYQKESPLSIHSDHCMCIDVVIGRVDRSQSYSTEGGSVYFNGTSKYLVSVPKADLLKSRNTCNAEGFESVALVPIRQGEQIVGLLHIADKRENMVPLELVLSLENAARHLGPALNRILMEERLKKYAETQSVLLKEINHRVKNNLSAIISILHLEADRMEELERGACLPVLRTLEGRIRGLSAVHSLLSARGWNPLNLSQLCREVADATVEGMNCRRTVWIDVLDSNIRINSTQSQHLTLVINELVTNAIKYGENNAGESNISILLGMMRDMVSLIFKDNGPGFPEKILSGNFDEDLIGLELVRGIVIQNLEGEVVFSNEDGAMVTVIFENQLKNEAALIANSVEIT